MITTQSYSDGTNGVLNAARWRTIIRERDSRDDKSVH